MSSTIMWMAKGTLHFCCRVFARDQHQKWLLSTADRLAQHCSSYQRPGAPEYLEQYNSATGALNIRKCINNMIKITRKLKPPSFTY